MDDVWKKLAEYSDCATAPIGSLLKAEIQVDAAANHEKFKQRNELGRRGLGAAGAPAASRSGALDFFRAGGVTASCKWTSPASCRKQKATARSLRTMKSAQPSYILHLLVALLDPVAQAIQTHRLRQGLPLMGLLCIAMHNSLKQSVKPCNLSSNIGRRPPINIHHFWRLAKPILSSDGQRCSAPGTARKIG